MRRLNNKELWQIGVGALVLALGVTLIAQRMPSSRTGDLNRPLETLFVMERTNNYLGEGAAISPDGELLVYIGGDNGLYLRNLETRQEQLLLKEAEAGLDVFLNPSFSPDGTRILFSASGGTYYYPSNIYSIRIDGSGLKRLTQAQARGPEKKAVAGNALYAQYFNAAQFGPDGTRILLQLYDAVRGDDNVALMDRDGSHLEVVDQGTPLFWSVDGQAVYYSQGDRVKRYDLRSKESQTISGLNGNILGRFSDREWFGVDTGQSVILVSVQDQFASAVATWNIPRTKLATRDGQQTAVRKTDQLVLTSFQWSRSGKLLLVYKGEVMERLEIAVPTKM